MFQSTHPHGVRLTCLSRMRIKIPSFNPRTHTGCDVEEDGGAYLLVVSIHAPTRGATETLQRVPDKYLFQSTHPHGVRHESPSFPKVLDKFQSTHPHGVRHYSNLLFHGFFMFQSTHPHGVRHSIPCDPASSHCFNPRTHTGCDPI